MRVPSWLEALFAPRGEVRLADGFTFSYVVSEGGAERPELRFVAERFVATLACGAMTIFDAERRAEYTVDRARKRLQALPPGARAGGLPPAAGALGRICAVFEQRPELVGTHWCSRRTVYNEGAGVVATDVGYFASIPGLERTALHQARILAHRGDPLALPPGPDELEVLSSRRLLSSDFGSSRTVRLVSVWEHVSDTESFDAILRFPLAG